MLLVPLTLLCASASLAGQAAADAPAPEPASWVTVPTPLDPRLVVPAPQPSEPAARTFSPRMTGEAGPRGAMVRGAVIGAALGGAWGLYLDLSADRDESFRGGMTTLGLVAGALNGALIGFVVHAVREL
jgi:hypothetical protein